MPKKVEGMTSSGDALEGVCGSAPLADSKMPQNVTPRRRFGLRNERWSRTEALLCIKQCRTQLYRAGEVCCTKRRRQQVRSLAGSGQPNRDGSCCVRTLGVRLRKFFCTSPLEHFSKGSNRRRSVPTRLRKWCRPANPDTGYITSLGGKPLE